MFSAPVPHSRTFAATVIGPPGTERGRLSGQTKVPSASLSMRTVAREPVSPVAVPAKDSVTGRESFAPDLGVDLAPCGLAVGGSSTVDVVEGEELAGALVAAGAGVVIGGEDFISQFSGLAAGVGPDVFPVGVAPLGVLVAEPLSVGRSSFSVTGASTGLADVPATDCRAVDDEL